LKKIRQKYNGGIMAKVILYKSNPCGYCSAAIRFLKEVKEQKDIEIIDLTGKFEERRDLAKKTGQRKIPQIYINDVYVGGYDDMMLLERTGKLDPLLENTAD
jgi:glutaredoxin 3